MRTHVFLLAVLFALAACGRDDRRLQAEISEQEKRVVRARTVYLLEQGRMDALKDSLEINIRHNISLSLDSTTATSIENERVVLQGTIVEAAKRNLDSQEEFLALLKKRLQAHR
ncbi:MAG: hypothetical protein OXU79_04385 [Gemmatimonadota bacterium]|nr:hypothetical protein [Gemmatimonadota bacterium]